MRHLLAILIALTLSFSVSANDNPVVHSEVLSNGMVLTIHQDLTARLNSIDLKTMELTAVSYLDTDPDGHTPVFTYTAAWTCTLGLEHRVETPVYSKDDVAMAEGASTHSAACMVMLNLFPIATTP